jgi:hypothetical protein
MTRNVFASLARVLKKHTGTLPTRKSLQRLSLCSVSLLTLGATSATAQTYPLTIPVGGNAVFDVSGLANNGYVGCDSYHGNVGGVFMPWATYDSSAPAPTTYDYKAFGITVSFYGIVPSTATYTNAELTRYSNATGGYHTDTGLSGGSGQIPRANYNPWNLNHEVYWTIYRINPDNSQTQVAQSSAAAGWGVRPQFTRDNNYFFATDMMFKSLAVFVPSTATPGNYTAQFTEWGTGDPQNAPLPPYDANHRSANVRFSVTASSGTAPAAPTSLTATTRNVDIDTDPDPNSLLVGSAAYQWFPVISWTPPTGSNLMSVSVTGPSGLGTPTTPLAVYDILSTQGTVPGNSFYYGIPGSWGPGTTSWDSSYSKLLDGGTYTFTVKARNAYGMSQPASVSLTMPSYVSVVRGGAAANVVAGALVGTTSTQTNIDYYHPLQYLPGSIPPRMPPYYYSLLVHPAWDILDQSGQIIASETYPNGWTVTSSTSSTYLSQIWVSSVDFYSGFLTSILTSGTVQGSGFTVQAPATAVLGRRYFVRTGDYRKEIYTNYWSGGPDKAAPFNVVP